MGKGFVEYSETVGKILANFQALEFLIRRYLYDKGDPPHSALQTQLNCLKVGDQVTVNAVTDWSSLRKLIERFNNRVAPVRPDLTLDVAIISLRDALAHGRMWLPEWDTNVDAPPLLLKFAQPRGDSAAVEFVEVASSEWLEATIKRVDTEIKKVAVARTEP